uniref:acetyl-coenzyme A synthetase N-terminal domain-containing protein n=2 Tax=Nocardia TaxID=1817 RepID=UPI00258C92F7
MTETNADHNDSYPPTAEFAAAANADASLYEQATADREGFWAEQANRLHWHQPFTHTLDWTNPPIARWFHDGKLNVAYNCLDRHVL